jgi:beta-ureidopropionase
MGGCQVDDSKIGRPVRITSISFNDRSLEEIAGIVDSEGAKGTDIIALPETWRGPQLETIQGETIRTMSCLAKKHNTYIVCPIFRDVDGKRYNSAILLDRSGSPICIYDKVYPCHEEFKLDPPVEVGTEVPVIDTDFGRIGMAICFDVNFPEVWKRLADQGAELVIWVSAYSAGTSLLAHALNHNYYIVSSTLAGDCIVYDINGREILNEKSQGINISRVTLDLDRGIYHENYNLEKRDRLLKDYEGSIVQDFHMEPEEWFGLRATVPGISARETAQKYGMVELRDYRNQSRNKIDKMRGQPLASNNG